MTATIHDGVGPLDQGRIEQLEEKVGTRLPEQYREFLLKFNGGYPEPDGFKFRGSDDGSSVDRFLGLDVGEYSNLEKYLDTYSGRIPEGFFPIAHDPGGNLVLIGLRGSHAKEVYFWDHELEADGYNPDMSNMYLIADCFNDFLDGLFEIEVD